MLEVVHLSPSSTSEPRQARPLRSRLGLALVLGIVFALATPSHGQVPEGAPRLATNPAPASPLAPTSGFGASLERGPQAIESSATPGVPATTPTGRSTDVGSWLAPQSMPQSLQWMVLLSALSLAPAALLMTTAFVRVVVVLTLLRQALGSPQLPPNQVLTALALFITLFVMAPTWEEVYREAALPYSKNEIGAEEAWKRGIQPIRQFMSRQIERTGNQEDVWLFVRRLPGDQEPKTYDEVPLAALVPAFMLSELKTAFLIGFQIYLPFIVLDLVAASVTTAMGMVMLPPGLVSLPLKLLVFVLADGWRLIVSMLLDGFVVSAGG